MEEKIAQWNCPLCGLNFSLKYIYESEDAKMHAMSELSKRVTHHVINEHQHEENERANKWLN